MMEGDYLATGFRDVDGVRNKTACVECLTLLDSLPYYRDCKNRSYELLELHPGQTVLEAGCGLGDDAFRMAGRIIPGGKIVGVDASLAMIHEASSRSRTARWPVQFLAGNIKALPFADNSFARCRIDRVLQHIPGPQRAVAELVRVLEPDGLLLAYDNDWGTFTIASEADGMTRIIERCWSDAFANSRMGRELPDLFRAAGLSDVAVHTGVSVITDFETADKVYNLRATVRKAVEQKLLSAARGCDWMLAQIERMTRGCFTVSLTAHTVVGRKNRCA